MAEERSLEWHRVLAEDELPEGDHGARRAEGDRPGLDDALRRALEHDGPSMVEVVADPELV